MGLANQIDSTHNTFMAYSAPIVNVASVPKRSVFRYPGGKTWLVPIIRKWLNAMGGPRKTLVEPFAGGAIVGLTAAFEDLVGDVYLNEIDADVSSVWSTIIEEGKGEWLAKEITKFQLNSRTVRVALGREPLSVKQRAFQTILRNRVQRGGILADGAGLMKAGENGKGLHSRWYPETLARRIRDIDAIRQKLQFGSVDGTDLIDAKKNDPKIIFFVDPPYTVAGARLYRHSEIDHRQLFATLSSVKGEFLITYDDSKEIRSLASQFSFDTELVPMKNTHHRKMEELLISRSLGWLRRWDSSVGSSSQCDLQTASM